MPTWIDRAGLRESGEVLSLFLGGDSVSVRGGPRRAREQSDRFRVRREAAIHSLPELFLARRQPPADQRPGNPNSSKVRRARGIGSRHCFDDPQMATIDALVSELLEPAFGTTESEGRAYASAGGTA